MGEPPLKTSLRLEGTDGSKEPPEQREADYQPRPTTTGLTSGAKRFGGQDGVTAYQLDYWRRTSGHNAPKYGITVDRFWEMVRDQGWACAICSIRFHAAGPKMAIDHNHNTGEVRGVLCSNCNWGLGAFRDSADALQGAVRYLTERGSYGPTSPG